MNLPREPFAWDGEEDLPVPLGTSTPNDPGHPVSSQILSEAETVVRDAQAAISRQDTDPTIPLTNPARPSDDSGPGDRRIDLMTRLVRPLSRRSLAVTLMMGCALAFIHGWSVGADTLPLDLVTRTTVKPSQASKEWREEQRP
jgi:hypothetical protein